MNMAKKKKSTISPVSEDEGFQIQIVEKEELLKTWLDPAESFIMSFQSVLVWEKPYHGAALLLSVNLLFWLAMSMRLYYLLGLTGAVLVFLDMWTSHLWPEIKASLASEEERDMEDWTHVHPHLMSVPEICHQVAWMWVTLASWVNGAVHLRETNRPKFFIFSILALSSLAAFGTYVPGIYLTYFTVMGCLLVPCGLYHNVFNHMHQQLDPVISKVESKMNIKRSRSRKGKKGRKKRGGERPQGDDFDTESDSEIEEFVPTPDLKGKRALSKPIVHDSDDESSLAAESLQVPSISASRDVSDVDDNDVSSLAVGLELPSFDDRLLDSSTSLTPENSQSMDLNPELDSTITAAEDDVSGSDEGQTKEAAPLSQRLRGDTKRRKKNSPSATVSGESSTAESMQFISSHFKESSDEDDESRLAQGLAFPDVDGETETGGDDLKQTMAESLLNQGQVLASAITAHQVTGTVTGLMASTVAGLHTLRASVMQATTAATELQDDEVDNLAAGTTKSDQGQGQGQIAAADATARTTAQVKMVDSNASDILEAEFEFLDQEELEIDQMEADSEK